MKNKFIRCLVILFLFSGYNVPEIHANVISTLQNKTHPFLYFSSSDIPDLRNAANTSHKKYFDYLKKWADKFIIFDPLPVASLPTNIDIMQVYCESGQNYIVNMSLIYQLTGNDTYLQAAKKWLLAFGSYPADIKGNFCVGAYATAVASGYDMLYNKLSPDERSHLSQHLAAIIQRGIKGTSTDWWAGITLNHDHWLPVTGLGVGAVALYYENPEAANWLKFLLDIHKTDMNIVGDDGAWTEGTADWIYALSLTYVFYDVYRKVSGEDLFQHPMVKNAIPYRLYNYLQDNTYIYHHDSFINGRYNVLGAASSHLLYKLAHEHKDGHIQWLASRDEIQDMDFLIQNKTPNNDWHLSKNSLIPALHCVGWEYLWYDPSVAPEPPGDLPGYHYFPNQELVIMRTGWQKSDIVFAFTCSPVGGHNARAAVLNGNKRMLSNYGHTHAQANTFDIYGLGNYLAVPPSYGQLESSSHNTLTIEGANQQRNPLYDARILNTDLRAEYAYIVGDATNSYPSSIGLERWYRHVAYLPPSIFVILDELKSSRTSISNLSTKWQLNYIPEAVMTVDSVNQIITISNQSLLKTNILYPVPTSYENRRLSWAARQVAAKFNNIFGTSKEIQIATVLSVLENNNVPAPQVQLIKGENMMGAAVDDRNISRAVVFCLNTGKETESRFRNFQIIAKAEIKCYVFYLNPNSGYDLAISSKKDEKGLINYFIPIKKGKELTTNSEGTLIFQLDGKKGIKKEDKTRK